MAKVMVSLPDALLARLDAEAAEHATTRSGALRVLVEAALGEQGQLLSARMRRLEGSARGHGGNVAAAVKADRPR